MNVLARVCLLCCIIIPAKAETGSFSTSYGVLLPEAKGVIPKAYGPVKAKVASNLVLSLQFNIFAGTGYKAGAVTAVTDTLGRVFKIVKQGQTCTITYATTGAVQQVSCSTSTRNLDVECGIRDKSNEQAEETEDGHPLVRRLAPPCSSCLTFVNTAFSSQITAVCGTPFSSLIPKQVRWMKSAAAAVCAMSTMLESPEDFEDVSYRVCRCSCASNTDCPLPTAICSGGLCLPHQFGPGEACPDNEDVDCDNNVCRRGSYPFGEYVCCLSNGDVLSPKDGERYCSKIQDDGAECDSDEICKSGVCSHGFCIAHKLLPGDECLSFDSNDCANGLCYRGSYPYGDPICCPSNAYVHSPTVGEDFCTKIQDDGKECDSDEICKSGICSGGKCVAHKLGRGEPCPGFDDGDCANDVCRRGTYPHGDPICCPSDSSVYSFTNQDNYCSGIQLTGDVCDSNEICASGVCSAGRCLDQKIEAGSPCPDGDNNDCANELCYRGSFPSGGYACCESNGYVYSPSTRRWFCSGIQNTGDSCDSNEICKDGFCKKGVCA